MDVLKGILILLGIGGAGTFMIWGVFGAFFGVGNLLFATISAILAGRRGRNACNWFFLTVFYGIFGLIFLACSKTLNQGEIVESDTLSKVMWAALFLFICFSVTIFMIVREYYF